MEEGTQQPGIDLIEKIAVGLGISPVWLAFGHEGALPFREKQPRPAVPFDDPVPEPGKGLFHARYVDCGERLRQVREQLGLSLRSLAEAANVSYQAVLNTETGLTVPKAETIEAIAVALDVAPGWLAYGDEEGE